MLVSGARYVPNENARTMKWRVCKRVDKMSIASFCRVCAFYYIPYFNDTATTEIYTLSLHDALPICI